MKSELYTRLKLRYVPVAIVLTDEKPQKALSFQEGKFGCVAAMLTAATKGKTVVFDRKTFGCGGGGVGLGLADKFPSGMEYFLSAEESPENTIYHGRLSEGYKKTAKLAAQWIEQLPRRQNNEKYVVFKPLDEISEQEQRPDVIVFYANPDQLAALTVLANYDRPGGDNVIIPFASGCQSACLLALNEVDKKYPRAVVGMLDISARPMIDADLVSFSVPYSMFKEMESNIAGSFLDRKDWQRVVKRLNS